MIVIKRDGRHEEFDKNKIATAIKKCGKFTEKEIDNLIPLFNKDRLTVKEIQTAVENSLMEHKYFDEARDYISYRYLHDVVRKKYNKLNKLVMEKLYAKDVENSNANVDEHSFGGRKGEMANVILKNFALDNCMTKMAKKNHEDNMIYIHDLDSYSLGLHNCLSIPLDSLLAKGFSTRQVDVRPAQSIGTALQLVAVIIQLQSLCQFGGVAVTHLDTSLVPYLRKTFYKNYIDGLKFLQEENNNIYQELNIDSDIYKSNKRIYDYALEKTQKELNQGVEGLFHNLNSLQSRSGNQLPFSSINYGTDVSFEGRMIIRSILECSIKGVGKFGSTSTFPCQIFKMKKGINYDKGDPNYDLFLLALKSTSKRLYPNYANDEWSNQTEAIKYDRKIKKQVIEELSESQKDKLKQVPKEILKLLYLDSDLNIIQEEQVVEENATMGKCKCSPCKTPLTMLNGCELIAC